MRYYPHYFFFPSCYSYYYRTVQLVDHEAVHLLFTHLGNYHSYR